MTCNRCFGRLGVATLMLLVAGYAFAAAPAGTGNKVAGPGYLGITFQDVNDGEISTLHLKDGHGAEILMVDHDGPAGKAGLREHDVVLSLNGANVEDGDQLRKMLREMQPGRSVSLNICRDGAERMVNATLGNKAEIDKLAWEGRWTVPSPPAGADDALLPPMAETPASSRGFGHGFVSRGLMALTPAYTGATVDAMGSQLADFFGVKDGKGLLVHDVDGNSPAASAGLRAGDVVTKINGARVGTEKDWTHALRDSKGRAVSLTVVRDRKEQMLTITPESKKHSSLEVPHGPNELPVPAQPLLVM